MLCSLRPLCRRPEGNYDPPTPRPQHPRVERVSQKRGALCGPVLTLVPTPSALLHPLAALLHPSWREGPGF